MWKGFFHFKKFCAKVLSKIPAFYPVKTPAKKTGIFTLLQIPIIVDFCEKVLIIIVNG